MELIASYNVRPNYHLKQENDRGYYYIDEIASFPQKTATSVNPSTSHYEYLYIDDIDCKVQRTCTAVTTNTGPVYEPVGGKQNDTTLKDEEEYLKIM